MEIHLISSGRQALNQFACIASKVEPYVRYIHLREKTCTAKKLMSGIHHLTNQGVPLSKIIINDRADVAHIAGVCGVQLAHHSLPPHEVKKAFPALKVGRSVHSLEQAKRAREEGADYILYGHIFATGSKPDLKPRGLKELTRIVDALNVPVIAIGGIKPEHVAAITATGASGFAVMTGITEAHDPLLAIQSYLEGRSLQK